MPSGNYLTSKLIFWNRNVLFRKRKFTFGLVIMISFMFFAMNSCNKENETMIQDNQSSSTMSTKERVNYYKSVIHKTGLENRDEGSPYTAEEAILGVETLLNYEYDDFTKRYNETFLKKDTITISKINGDINDDVVSDIYDEVLSIMECHFAGILETNKKEMLVDMYNVSENSQELQVGVINIVGLFPDSGFPNTLSFVSGDD